MKRIATMARLGIAVALFAACVGTGCSESKGVDEPIPEPSVKDDDVAEIDRWMFDYMKTHYLWNQAVQQVTPNYNLEYGEFLDDVLKKVAAQNDVNHDDGHWENGKRSYFYSNVQRYKKSTASVGIQTRGTRLTAEGLGIEMLFYAELSKTSYAFIVAAVTPGSPADKAGLKRGDIVSRVDGAEIKDANLDACWTKLTATESGTVRMTRFDLATQKELSEISVTAASYADNPVWKAKTVFTANGKKVGYLCYGSFNYYYDDKLIEAFKQFRDEQIDELVLDLRYNGGGHVVASTVLGTLIAGETHKGEVYARTTYNEDRKNEVADIYKLGVAQYNAGNSGAKYAAIETALASSVGLERVFVLCTSNTASASELVVNGLRGVDIEVHLIGSTTNGKNVGMEPLSKTFGNYEYDFSPITFYIANGKGFSAYGNGFDPDVEAEDVFFYREDASGPIRGTEWGDEEHETMFKLALEWIETGSKPIPSSPQQAAATRGFENLQLRSLAPVRVQDMLLLPPPRSNPEL